MPYVSHLTILLGDRGPLEEGNYIMDDVDCVGDEMSLFDCKYNTNHDCSQMEGSVLYCKSLTLNEGNCCAQLSITNCY